MTSTISTSVVLLVTEEVLESQVNAHYFDVCVSNSITLTLHIVSPLQTVARTQLSV